MSKSLKFRIKVLRRSYNISVDVLATKCQVTTRTIRKWENLQCNDSFDIPSDSLRIMSILFDCSMEDMYAMKYESVTY